MIIKGEKEMRAARETVWRALNDPEVLRLCIPGCTALEEAGPNQLAATVSLAIGPVKARFSGTVHLKDLRPPASYRIEGEGQGGIAGFARGAANVRLVEADGGTRLEYEADSAVGGKIAQLGSRLIESTARKLSDQFFTKFAAVVEELNQEQA
ncbi:MAG: CoxG family protein [Rhizobiaceae bacterium]|jgi:carbon monoxide dehydrogenase subunit G